MTKVGVISDIHGNLTQEVIDHLQACEYIVCAGDTEDLRLIEQMRALAAKGGVAQTTLYHGFLRSEGEATIMDAIEHLEHAIKVMGIDHVGLGTDFDGDGGIRGLADSSELINFTRQLLARRYSESDIQKIWGGNFLRVMSIVQNASK